MSRRSKNKPPRNASAGYTVAAAQEIQGATPPKDRNVTLAIGLFIATLVWVVFGQAERFEFVNYDDSLIVYQNLHVMKGLSVGGIVWAFTHFDSFFYTPLTTISHMLDWQLYGKNAGGHHLTSVLIHGASSILLFLALKRMSGALWCSAFVAALFAIHPQHVESVAWVAERKDVLSGLFFMLTLWAYWRYAKGPRSLARYLVVVAVYALGLLSKPLLVTLPLVLLLLDYWPLERASAGRGRSQAVVWVSLIVEKIPLLVLSAASSVLTVMAEDKAIQPVSEYSSIPMRSGNALVSYVAYIAQMFYPVKLEVFYPHPGTALPAWEIFGALVALAGITAAVWILRKGRPWLLTGWLWYLVVMAPMSGIVQVGMFARADRFTYLPQIGLFIMIAWGAAEICGGLRNGKALSGLVAAAVLIALALCAHAQTATWQNTETLWWHTIACDPGNMVAHDNLSSELLGKEETDEAIEQSRQALAINHADHVAYNNLGIAFQQKGEEERAMEEFQRALEMNPTYAKARENLGEALVKKKKLDEAAVQFRKGLESDPDNAKLHYDLSHALMLEGNTDEAITHLEKALEAQPDDETAHYNLGLLFMRQGRTKEAADHYKKALKIQPGYTLAQNNLAWVLATSPDSSLRNGTGAVKLAQEANLHSGGNDPSILDTLSAAYAEAGRFPDAVSTAEKALALAEAQGNKDLSTSLQGKLLFYKAGKPFREKTPAK